eukprot:3192667-Alexandrium_andersonii.AAC.1
MNVHFGMARFQATKIAESMVAYVKEDPALASSAQIGRDRSPGSRSRGAPPSEMNVHFGVAHFQ